MSAGDEGSSPRGEMHRKRLTLALGRNYNPACEGEQFNPKEVPPGHTLCRPALAKMILRLQALKRPCLAALFALGLSAAAAAQQRPLITEDVDIIPPGTVRLQLGVDFMQDVKLPASGLRGDLTRVGVVGVNVGLAPNVEFQIEGVLQNFLSVNSATAAPPIPRGFAGGSTNVAGDFRLST